MMNKEYKIKNRKHNMEKKETEQYKPRQSRTFLEHFQKQISKEIKTHFDGWKNRDRSLTHAYSFINPMTPSHLDCNRHQILITELISRNSCHIPLTPLHFDVVRLTAPPHRLPDLLEQSMQREKYNNIFHYVQFVT